MRRDDDQASRVWDGPWARGQVVSIARKDKPKPRTCPRCRGSGGWWEVSNGKGFGGGKRRWRSCPLCGGSGVVTR